jgi:hypothetical protein
VVLGIIIITEVMEMAHLHLRRPCHQVQLRLIRPQQLTETVFGIGIQRPE